MNEMDRLTIQYRANARAEILNVKTALLAKEGREDEISDLVRDTFRQDFIIRSAIINRH